MAGSRLKWAIYESQIRATRQSLSLIFWSGISREFPGMGKDFPGMTLGDFPGISRREIPGKASLFFMSFTLRVVQKFLEPIN